jgi:ethanolamine utilization protein EutA
MDIAGLLGRHIQDLTSKEVQVVTIDGIEVSEFDYLDIGAFVPGTGAMPIVVKSLLFPTPTD